MVNFRYEHFVCMISCQWWIVWWPKQCFNGNRHQKMLNYVSVTGEWLTAILSVQLDTIEFLLLLSVAGTPIGVTANRTGYTSVLVSWSAPSPPSAGYELFYQTTAGVSSRLSGGNTSNTELTPTGLTLGEAYSIFVVAFGEDGAPMLPSELSQ